MTTWEIVVRLFAFVGFVVVYLAIFFGIFHYGGKRNTEKIERERREENLHGNVERLYQLVQEVRGETQLIRDRVAMTQEMFLEQNEVIQEVKNRVRGLFGAVHKGTANNKGSPERKKK